MEEVQDLRARDPGEKVFVPTRESDHLVGKNRADDQQLVIIEEACIDGDGHLHGEESAGEFVDLLRGERTDLTQRRGVVPLVVEKLHGGIALCAFLPRDLESLADGLLAHGSVCAEGDHHVDCGRHGGELPVDLFENHAERAASRGIRNDQENALAAHCILRKALGNDLGDLL